MLAGGSLTSARLTFAMLLPTSRTRATPAVPVTTTASSSSTLGVSCASALFTVSDRTTRRSVPSL